MAYMSSLTGLNEENLANDLRGVIFPLPTPLDSQSPINYVTADEYLSGNVREKLQTAKLALQTSDIYRSNVEALESAQPKDLDASEIDVRLGATWIDKEYVQQFMYELFDTPPTVIRDKLKLNTPHLLLNGILAIKMPLDIIM